MPSFLTTKKRQFIISKKLFIIFGFFLFLGIFFAMESKRITNELLHEYKKLESTIYYDRNGEILGALPNERGNYCFFTNKIPPQFMKLLIQKEDQYFLHHKGINPISTFRAFFKILFDDKSASSTLTQQLTKVLLEHENERTLFHKFQEIWYASMLEVNVSKEQILEMYINSIFLGNQTQGIGAATELYFNHSSNVLTEKEMYQLLATIRSPSDTHPFSEKNLEISKNLYRKMNDKYLAEEKFSQNIAFHEQNKQKKRFSSQYGKINLFEFLSFPEERSIPQNLSIDKNLQNTIRLLAEENLKELTMKNATHASVIVISYPENELLALIGSPNPQKNSSGNQINMALERRPIGSTFKPFLFAKGFEKGLRPYSLVDDKEYKYEIGTGFAFYPKNYDYIYNGRVNLHYSLSNSLNTPSVKVMEYVGISETYQFLKQDLEFTPMRDFEEYQLGIALGHLEMSPLELAKYATIFGQNGNLCKTIIRAKTPHTGVSDTNPQNCKKVFSPEYVELVNSILIDRKTGSDQFGLKSNLNSPYDHVAIKTGTSREFHDSWIMGYTPDFLVLVWVGNPENKPMDEVSGQVGAGKIWNQVMDIMLNSKYHKKNIFKFDHLEEYIDEENREYGLKNDKYDIQKNLLIKNQIITAPHHGDTYLWEKHTKIFLKSSVPAYWEGNEIFLGEGENIIFHPKKPGTYEINAFFEGAKETITIFIE